MNVPEPRARIIPLVLAGGSGTRLWPLSRAALPKQFLKLVDEVSTFQRTLLRLAEPSLFELPIVLTSAELHPVVLQQAKEIGMPVQVVLEPHRRDSCAAVLAGTLVAKARDKRAIVMALAADQLIVGDEAFLAAVRAGLAGARSGRIVTFGIKPDRASTSMGYICPGEALTKTISTVAGFVEKPDQVRAAELIAEGWLWNSGNLLFAAKTFLDEARRLAPATHAAVSEAVSRAQEQNGAMRLDAATFSAAPTISVDFAVLEKTDKTAVVKSGYRFCDLGSWEAVFEASTADGDGNRLQGAVEVLDASECYVRSEGPLTAVLGLSNVIVISTPDAILVADRSSSQKVKELAARIAKTCRRLVADPVHSHRPWGWFHETDRGDRFRVKRIVVEPGGRLSLQKHCHRAEHWVVVRGIAEVTIGDSVQWLGEDRSIYVPAGSVHRLANPGRIPLELIEVQTGAYLEEDDIMRLEDVYNRA